MTKHWKKVGIVAGVLVGAYVVYNYVLKVPARKTAALKNAELTAATGPSDQSPTTTMPMIMAPKQGTITPPGVLNFTDPGGLAKLSAAYDFVSTDGMYNFVQQQGRGV